MNPVFDRDRLTEIREGLHPYYERYTMLVSDPGWAMSLETAAVLHSLADQLPKPRMLVDLGSGFSSFTLRLWASTHPGCGVLSVDSDLEWLRKTGRFLAGHGLPTKNLRDWATFRPFGVAADLVFHDLASGTLRESAMVVAVACCSPSGIVVFDDMQHEGHRNTALELCDAHGLTVIDLESYTMDAIGRFAIAGIRE